MLDIKITHKSLSCCSSMDCVIGGEQTCMMNYRHLLDWRLVFLCAEKRALSVATTDL